MIRLQHVLPSAIITIISIWVCWISYTQTPAEAFLFPRLISTLFVLLSLWTLGEALLGKSKETDGINWALLRNIAPGVLVAIIYVFWAAKGLGFYTATSIAFFVLLTLYDPNSHSDPKSWGKRLAITAGFIAVMYGLFAKILKVYTPRELLF